MTKGQKLTFRILFFLYLAGVLFLCFGKFDNTPSVEISLLGIPTDKLVHFAMFFPFPILAYFALGRFKGKILSILFAGILLAVATEWGQAHLTNYRSGDPLDLLADTLALILSSVIVAVVTSSRGAQSPTEP